MRITGNLTLNTLGQSELQNTIIERVSVLPDLLSSEKGRVVFKTTDSVFYYNTGSAWMSIATGGNASALQDEVNSLEAALGSAVAADGTFNSQAFAGLYTAGATSLTDAISKIESAVTGHNTLSELDDVTLTSTTTNQTLSYNGLKWVNHTVMLADATDLTASAAEVNQLTGSGVVTSDLAKLHNITASAAEVNQLTGSGVVTSDLTKLHDISVSAIQINNVGATTATTAELNLLAGTSIVTSDLTKLHNISVSATEINQLIGVSGNVQDQLNQILNTYQPLDADLTTIANFAPLAPSSEELTVNGHQVITDSYLSDFMVSDTTNEGSRWVLNRGIDARTSMGLGNIATFDESFFLRTDANSVNSNVSKDVSWNNFKITNLAAGVQSTDAVNLGQLQASQSGLSWKQAVKVATLNSITLSGLQTIDGIAVVTNDRVLVKAQTTDAANGIYVVNAGAWTRAADAASAAALTSAAVFVEQGTLAETAWVSANELTTLDTDSVAFVQFAGSLTAVAGIGLTFAGNQLNVNTGAGLSVDVNKQVNVDLYSESSSALILTTDGTTRSSSATAQLGLLLDTSSTGKLTQSLNGLKVAASTISEYELSPSVAGNGLTGGGAVALAVVSATGTAATAGDKNSSTWDGVGTLTITADSVGVTLGKSATTAAPGNHTHASDEITFSNTTSGLSASNVQAAIDEAVVRVGTLEANTSNSQGELDAVELSAGLNANGTFVVYSGTYASSGTSIRTAVEAVETGLSAEISSEISARISSDQAIQTAVNDRLSKIKATYTSISAASTHTFDHNLNDKYVNVTVIDSVADEVIIPQSIVYNTANQLTVTLNAPLSIIVVAMGVGFGNISIV